MIKTRGILLLVAALAVAFFVANLISSYLKDTTPAHGMVLVAAGPISAGDILTQQNLKRVKWPSSDIPPGSFHDLQKVLGRTAAAGINSGEPINEKRLVPGGGFSDKSLNSRIDPGMRVISIELDRISGIPGSLATGDMVDVLAASALDKNQSAWISRIILSRVRVLALGNGNQSVKTRKKSKKERVTLLLTVAKARILTASEGAVLKLIKRNPSDEDKKEDGVTVFSNSLGPKTISQINEMVKKRDDRMQKGIDPGMRAVTIRVNDEDGICGFLRPGNRVDVMGTNGFIQAAIHGKREAGTKATVTDKWQASKILMQNVKILFIEEDVAITGNTSPQKADSSRPQQAPSLEPQPGAWVPSWPTKRVTVLVSPQDAERLTVIATTSDKIKLILRKAGDCEIVDTKGEKSNEIFSKEKEDFYDIAIFGRGTARGKKRFDRKKLEEEDSLNLQDLGKESEI